MPDGMSEYMPDNMPAGGITGREQFSEFPIKTLFIGDFIYSAMFDYQRVLGLGAQLVQTFPGPKSCTALFNEMVFYSKCEFPQGPV